MQRKEVKKTSTSALCSQKSPASLLSYTSPPLDVKVPVCNISHVYDFSSSGKSSTCCLLIHEYSVYLQYNNSQLGTWDLYIQCVCVLRQTHISSISNINATLPLLRRQQHQTFWNKPNPVTERRTIKHVGPQCSVYFTQVFKTP